MLYLLLFLLLLFSMLSKFPQQNKSLPALKKAEDVYKQTKEPAS